MRHYYEYNGVVQATLIQMRRFVADGEDIDVGVGCDREEADAELTASIQRREREKCYDCRIGAACVHTMPPNQTAKRRRSRPLERAVRPCNHTDERSEMMTRHCDDCGHTGDEGGSTTESYCGSCGATVPYPKEDKCQECGATNCMLIACPKCGGQYWEHEQQEEA